MDGFDWSTHTWEWQSQKDCTRLVVSVVQCKVGTALSDTYVLCCPFKIKVCLDLTMRGRKSCLTGRGEGEGGCGHFYV